MVKQVYSRRFKRNVYRLDIRYQNGKRIRQMFFKKSEAEAAAYKIKHDAILRRFGLPPTSDRPTLAELSTKYTDDIQKRREQTRSKRVLADFSRLLTPDVCVDEITKADFRKYITKRFGYGVTPQTIDRELNIIVAMLNQADTYFSTLEHWHPPKMPRPKILDGRRERVWSKSEIQRVLSELLGPPHDNESAKSAVARYRVGRKVQFCLLNGLRHGEMNLLQKTAINWNDREVRIRQDKTGTYKVIGPLGATSMEILSEFVRQSKTEFVFSRSGSVTSHFYEILREACRLAGVPYGRNRTDGLVLHDARHTATTHLLENKISPKTVQEWMGWSDKAFVLYYSHASKQSREEAGHCLEQLAGDNAPSRLDRFVENA